MPLELRPYQREALDALYAYWADGGGNGLIVLPTGAGKALLLAKLIEELLRDYPELRICNITHSASLVRQNFEEFIGLSPFANAGIYSASLKQRNTHAQVIFCGIQSVAKRVDEVGAFDLVLIDEAHAISRNTDALYGKFFSALLKMNPDMRIAGTTATDYRMDSGRLTDGEDEIAEDGTVVSKRMFDDVVYEAKLTDLIEAGYLTRLVSGRTGAKIDIKSLHTRGGEYVPGEVSDAAELIIEDAVAEDMVMSADRKAGLFFSTSKVNAIHIRDAIRRHGRTCEALTSDNAHETDRIFREFRAGTLWAISSVNMVGTGTNFPFVDFISLIFSTKSAGKLVQFLGRGTRNSPGKEDCLVSDHGRNLAFHGPIDQISPKAPGSGDGEQPQKLCPQDKNDAKGNPGCGELVPISRMTCHCCGYIFPPSEEEKITAQADIAPVLSTAAPVWHSVTARTFREHVGKDPNKPPSVRVDYMLGMVGQREWLCPQHTGYAKTKANRYWAKHSGATPYPASVQEWLERVDELAITAEVKLKPAGKYQDIVDWIPGAANDNYPASVKPLQRKRVNAPTWSGDLDDSIPF